MSDQIVNFIMYCIPALIVGAIAFYFFRMHIQNEDRKRFFLLQQENQKYALPIRLQAYERMTLFLERITPQQLFLRIPPHNFSKQEYEILLVNSIDEEFEHNLAQQIYLSGQLWQIIRTAKIATIHVIRKAAHNDELKDSQAMVEGIFKEFAEKATPSANALSHLKEEVKQAKKRQEAAQTTVSPAASVSSSRVATTATNFDILKRISRLEKEVFGKQITE